MRSADLLAALLVAASLYAASPALAQQASREGTLAQRDFSDCSNADVRIQDPAVGGTVSVDRGSDGNTHVRVVVKARPDTTYHFFLKCVRLLGDITTGSDGFAVANFNFRTNEAGDVFAFDMYPDGAPLGNKFQSTQMNFRNPQTESSRVTLLPPAWSLSRETKLVKRDFSDCSNADVRTDDRVIIGGFATVDRSADGNTHVRTTLTAQPNTTYHFFLKCVRHLGDLTTKADGTGIANFDFRTNEVGDVFAFDMYPNGAPLGNKYQSVQVDFRRPAPEPQPVDPPPGPASRLEYVSQTPTGVSFTYEKMPAGVEVVLVAAHTGLDTERRMSLREAGDGSAEIPLAADQYQGDYYLLARSQAGKEYLGRSVVFYLN